MNCNIYYKQRVVPFNALWILTNLGLCANIKMMQIASNDQI